MKLFLPFNLHHPYIARPFDAGIDSSLGQYAAYPEYTEPPLLQWSKSSNKADLQRVALQIAEVLAFLHRRGWLYHDFKPEHFLIGAHSIRVLDLGLAQKVHESSNTFSGTFPYIAPERLTGRKCDARSDIFALGMILLHILVPNEEWDFEPSIEALQNLQKRTAQLSSFWKGILSEMISLEPAQRIESAAELWKRLLPKNAQNNFLFFHLPPYFDIPSNLLNTKRLTVFETAIDLIISEIERMTLRQSWENGIFTISFNLRNTTPEGVLRTLSRPLLGEEQSDLFSAIESLRKTKNYETHTILLMYPESLSSSQRAQLSYALTALQSAPSLHFVLLARSRLLICLRNLNRKSKSLR